MRTRVNKYTIVGDRQVKLETPITIEDVRLIINETKKIVIASSMQKDNITIEGGVITYTDTLPISEVGDYFTIEIDKGTIDTTLYAPCDLSALDAWWAEQSTDKEITE
jgi:hypothetical protein